MYIYIYNKYIYIYIHREVRGLLAKALDVLADLILAGDGANANDNNDSYYRD